MFTKSKNLTIKYLIITSTTFDKYMPFDLNFEHRENLPVIAMVGIAFVRRAIYKNSKEYDMENVTEDEIGMPKLKFSFRKRVLYLHLYGAHNTIYVK